MAIDESEREQVEALKKWWKENGRVATVGLVVGLAGVFGWTSWQTYAAKRAETASSLYEQLVNWTASGNPSRADEIAEIIMRDFPNSGYAPLSGLIRASSAFSRDQVDEARGYLQWVLDNAREPAIKRIARLRIARLALDQNDAAGALALLEGVTMPGTLKAEYEELHGDTLHAQGKLREAAEAYASALSATGLSAVSRDRLELKLNDLGLGAEPEQ